MSLSSTISRVSYAGNGVTTAFSFPYYFIANADLVVILRDSSGTETTKTITTHYTVTGAGVPAGGTVTMVTAPASGETLVIYRDPAVTQTTDLVENDPLPAETVEQTLDRLTMMVQRLKDRVDRAVRMTDGYAAAFDPSLPSTLTALKVLRINSGGTGIDLATQESFTFDAASPTTTKGDLIVRSSSANARLPVGTNNQVLTADSSQTLGVKWADSDVLVITTKGDLLTRNSSAAVRLPVGSNNQALVADSAQSAGIKWAAIGITSYTEVTGTSQTMSVSNGYIANHASTRINFTLPTTAAIGEMVSVQGYGDGGWRVTQNSGQQIVDGNDKTFTGTVGEIRSFSPRDSVVLQCVVANTTWKVMFKSGDCTKITQSYYMGGSSNGAGTTQNTIFKFGHVAETGANVAATLDQAREDVVGVTSYTRGYAGGGSDGATRYAGIDYIQYSDDTSVALAATLDAARAAPVPAQNDTKTNGYFIAGSPSSGTYTTAIGKLVFSGETEANISATLPTALTQTGGASFPIKACIFGGINGGGELSAIQSLNFSAEATSTTGATLAVTKYAVATVYDREKAYLVGGLDGGDALSVIDRFDAATETRLVIQTALGADRAFASGMNGSAKGYICAGYNDATTTQNTIYSVDYLTEATATVGDTLDAASRLGATCWV